MKILCDRQQLQEAFTVVGGIPPLKTPKPVIQNVLLRATEEGVTLYATDLEMSAKVAVPAVKVSKPGSVLLPARETAALLRELSDPTLTLTGSDDRCSIDSGTGSFVLLGEDPAQFPPEPGFKLGLGLELPVAEFLGMIRRTSFAAAREETRYAINGLLFDYQEGCARLVGTDGRRLALCYVNVDGPAERTRVVVPIRALHALAKAIPEDAEEPLAVSIGQNQIRFSIGGTELISQLLDNRFPEYEQVIPKAADSTIEIDREQLERNLRRVAVLSSGDVRMVRFEFEGTELKLSAESSGVGRADVSMGVDLKGPGGAISFNPDFLLDALKVSDLETVRIDMTDDATPAKFTLGESYTYILMPISGS
jgi:DNA polymerase-3 subunit beta